ncbi:hypothetical protein [Vibrio vulnificus]|uniref:hypothetical protein n=1 Tax=Vibrio vulnificus TaxID=672 RepID=UPI000D3EC2D1|nr:hypothetical protein [Vibrio vulnificus]MBN8142865.1 hypothetical protein [Vibrio vulnificus]MBN8152141.1 hypothetical protein [Vibrio vulnificus]MDS1873354.1 hypothetical protein [Vibrio vulnificus]NIG90021.1 hypothetical protein [Vibrio vulnificus]PUZ79166.1 hypothetical protein DC357_20950 [Vibrio vulnificus]
MVDISMLSAALGSVKTATEIAKLIKESGTSLEKAEVKLQIAELISTLADIKMELADVQTLLIQKDEEIAALQNKLMLKESVIWEKPYYFIKDGEKKDGPYCQQCWDSQGSLIRLQGGGAMSWRCLRCRGEYQDSNYVPIPIVG